MRSSYAARGKRDLCPDFRLKFQNRVARAVFSFKKWHTSNG